MTQGAHGSAQVLELENVRYDFLIDAGLFVGSYCLAAMPPIRFLREGICKCIMLLWRLLGAVWQRLFAARHIDPGATALVTKGHERRQWQGRRGAVRWVVGWYVVFVLNRKLRDLAIHYHMHHG